MTEEDKKLLMIDLCARLPYGVICYDEVQNESGMFKQFEYEGFGRIHIGRGLRFIENIKPYLRQMSSMSEREKEEFQYIAGGKILKDYIVRSGFGLSYKEIAKIEDWLNKYHFDYRGLIEKGLALEAPEDMYKKN